MIDQPHNWVPFIAPCDKCDNPDAEWIAIRSLPNELEASAKHRVMWCDWCVNERAMTCEIAAPDLMNRRDIVGTLVHISIGIPSTLVAEIHRYFSFKYGQKWARSNT